MTRRAPLRDAGALSPWVWKSRRRSRSVVIKNGRPRRSVTQRDHANLETLTAPNPGPLLVQAIGNILTNQCGSGRRRLVHNHPSGDPTPSRADIEMTKAIIEVAKPLGIAVHDHLIVGKAGHASFKGLLLI